MKRVDGGGLLGKFRGGSVGFGEFIFVLSVSRGLLWYGLTVGWSYGDDMIRMMNPHT